MLPFLATPPAAVAEAEEIEEEEDMRLVGRAGAGDVADDDEC